MDSESHQDQGEPFGDGQDILSVRFRRPNGSTVSTPQGVWVRIFGLATTSELAEPGGGLSTVASFLSGLQAKLSRFIRFHTFGLSPLTPTISDALGRLSSVDVGARAANGSASRIVILSYSLMSMSFYGPG